MSKRFDAFEIAIEMIESLKSVLQKIRSHDRDLFDQMRRAMSSVALNVNEGSRLQGGNATKAFTYAAGSSKEVQACIRVACAFGDVSEDEVRNGLELIDRENAMLWRLTRGR